MALSRRNILTAAAATALARPGLLRAQSQSGAPIRIGDITSYAAYPEFAGPYRKGWEMAVAHVNELGGVNGRRIEVVARDDAGSADNAVRIAGELINDQKVDLLAGGYLSDIALAISAFALQNKTLYVAGEPATDALVWEKGNRYTYRVRPSTFMLAAMLVETALAQPAKTWATVAPDTDYGRSAVMWFRKLLSARRPDVQFVGEQWPALGHIDAASVVNGLGQPGPQAIFNALFGSDLDAFVRQGSTGGLFNGRLVASMMTGDPEYLAPLGANAPAGWIVTGYPWSVSDDPSNKQFVLDYTERYHEPPAMGSVVGVAMINAIVSGIMKSGSTESEAMADGFAGAAFTTPFGICRFRPVDHQSTLGSYVGRLAVQNGQAGMVDWRYVDGAAVMPTDADVRTLRPA